MYSGVIGSHTVIWLSLSMEDILLALTCEDVTAHVTFLFLAQFCIKVTEPASEFLDIRTQRPDMIEINQGPYVQSILAKTLNI